MTEWNDIASAPRDGSKVRIKDDAGNVRRMSFAEPHWWDVGEGRLRIVDGHLVARSDISKAKQWQVIE